jgi:hypothetical protein
MRKPCRRMPFGRFRGTRLENLPDFYLGWLLRLPDLRDPLLGAVRDEARRRAEMAAVNRAARRVRHGADRRLNRGRQAGSTEGRSRPRATGG